MHTAEALHACQAAAVLALAADEPGCGLRRRACSDTSRLLLHVPQQMQGCLSSTAAPDHAVPSDEACTAALAPHMPSNQKRDAASPGSGTERRCSLWHLQQQQQQQQQQQHKSCLHGQSGPLCYLSAVQACSGSTAATMRRQLACRA